MKRYFLTTAAAAAFIAAVATAPPAAAQARWQIGAIDTNWTNDSNWDTFFTPDPTIDSLAGIGAVEFLNGNPTGWNPSAVAEVFGAVNSPTVVVADGAGVTGTVTIGSGASLNVQRTTTGGGTLISSGDVQIGLNGGLGVMNVAGALSVAQGIETPTGGDFQSTLRLSGSANVSAQYGFLDRQLRVVGPNVSFTTTGTSPSTNSSLILGGGGVHTWEFGASGLSTLQVAGNLDLGGTLGIETPGYTPTVGASWVLADSVSVDANESNPSGFNFIDASGVPNLQPGATFIVRSQAGGTNGVQTILALEQHPVLTVNRQTGMASLRNYSASASTIAFDSYAVRSNSGSLSPTAWTSLDDTGASGNTWYEANPQATGLSELNPTTTIALSGNQTIQLGKVFTPSAPAAFGDENEDIFFQFGTADGGIVSGQVVYEGLPNNTLVLNVDPTTGAAQLLNPSGFNVGIDSYVISSESGSLSTSAWSSLDDQNLGGVNQWFEANVSSNRLAELLIDGATPMDANVGAVYGIGTPWVTSGQRDLVFQFALEGETSLRTGKVVYGAQVSAVTLPGDFNNDGFVNAADYTVWRDADGTSTTLPNDPTPGTVGLSDYQVWASNYGATAGGSVAIPEPTALVLAMTLALGLARRAP